MAEKEYRLCGGTFFTLLNHCKKPSTRRRPLGSHEPETITDTILLTELIKVFNPDYVEPAGKSFNTMCNKFKSCQTNNSVHIPFDNQTLIDIFTTEYSQNYSNVLVRIVDFTNQFIMPRQISWLVSALIELISCDSSITDETVLYNDYDGNPITKSGLETVDEIVLQHFLLGLFHFIITQRPDNTIGEETYKDWHTKPDTKGGRYEFSSKIGMNTKRTIGIQEITDRDSMRLRRLYPAEEMVIIPPTEDANTLPLYLVPSQLLTPRDEYTEYLNETREKYLKLRTLLYNDEPRPFYSFYVPNDIVRRPGFRGSHGFSDNLSVDTLLRQELRFSIVTGTGGLGKSMLMRHILLTAIGRYDVYKYVPIFIALKDYDDTYESLFDFIFSKYKNLAGAKDQTGFEQLLKYGRCLLLLDGLDEINTQYIQKFEKDIESFIDRYSRNKLIISSRPAGDFLPYSRFSVYSLKPLSLDQALLLIDKLEFRPDEPEFKQKFRDALETKLYRTQKEFAQNPLLLTIMLMTFEQYGEITSKMHVFYREAYSALAQRHDANKGGYKRKFETNLSPDEFANYFSEFCAKTYYKEMYELTDDEFDRVFNNLNILKLTNSNVASSDFKKDLTKALCLMYFESSKYHFTHRSFQEYFCALFFSKQKDKSLAGIGNFFESKKTRTYSDKTFAMLYDMIPEKVEEYIFLPFLENLINDCKNNEGYITFLERLYPEINYEYGDTPDMYITLPHSYLYSFIISTFFQQEMNINTIQHPFVEDFVTDELAFIEEDWELDDEVPRPADYEPDYKLVSKDEIDVAYYQNHDEPDTVGYFLTFQPAEVLRHKDKYPEMANYISGSSYPLVEEYEFIQSYYNYIFEKATKSEAEDLFDTFI